MSRVHALEGHAAQTPHQSRTGDTVGVAALCLDSAFSLIE